MEKSKNTGPKKGGFEYREPLYYMKLAKREINKIANCGPDDGAHVLVLKKKATKYVQRARAAQAERGWSDDDKRMVLPASQ